MPHALAFDTHRYVKKMKEVGFTEQQAEAQAETLADFVGNNLTTKQDLKELELRTDTKLVQLKNELIRWDVGVGAAELSIIVGLKIFN